MTGRYIRKPVPLEVKGLSRVTLDEHPTGTLEIIDQPGLPEEFSREIAVAISSYQETPLSSNRSSPTIIETQSHSPSLVQGIWTTGNTTERSSVSSNYSWDEFDRQAAKTVQHLFDEIDSVLYEKRPIKEEYIYNECQEWGSQFPHLRILGKQVLSPQDTGYQMIEREASRPSTTSSLGLMDVTEQDISQDSQGLSISGRQVWAVTPPIEARSRSSGTPSTQMSEFSHLEEEIFESEGEYEEIIAVDYKDIYEDHSDNKKQLTPRRRTVKYPPITPNACLKDSVASSAFDCIWHEVISWIRPLMKKYASVVLDENKPMIIPIRDSITSLSQTLRNESTPGPPSRENSTLKMSRAHTIMGPTIVESPKLDGVLHITKKMVVNRETSIADASDSQLSVTARPASSFVPGPNKQRPMSTRNPRGQGRGAVRLAPIQGIDSRSKTPNVDEDRALQMASHASLLVRKIHPPPVMARLHSPTGYRNGALPPIGMDLDGLGNSRMQKKASTSRASSAIEKDPRVPFKERFNTSQEARPSTTHAMRTDTPNGYNSRRASTPFGSSFNTMVQRNPSFGPGGMVLGITGSGLQPTSDIGHLGNIPQEILEDHEGGLDDVINVHSHSNQWTPSTPSNNPYRRGRQISSLVRS